jgi:aspartate kinase
MSPLSPLSPLSETTVLKIGGSVLTGVNGYRVAADWVSARLATTRDRLVVVVSAEYGHTDALFREAQQLADPAGDLLDLLWSTGETRSVALLALRLRAIGASVTGVSVHEVGLTVCGDTERITFNARSLRAALDAHRVVVVPGFLATKANRVVTLGRGGSDWSAVLLAASLGASRCELIKDVDGYFTADPHTHRDAELIRQLSYAEALRMADGGCPLVQRQAIAEAARARLPLVIRSLASQGTILHSNAQE